MALNPNIGIRMMVTCRIFLSTAALFYFLFSFQGTWPGFTLPAMACSICFCRSNTCVIRANSSPCPSHNCSQGHNPQEAAWDKHAPLQPSKVSKPKQPAQPLPLDEALAEIRNSTASIIDFQVI